MCLSFLKLVARPKPLVTFQDRIKQDAGSDSCRRGRKACRFFFSFGRCCCTIKVSACMHLMCVNAERSLNSWLPPYAVDVGGPKGFSKGKASALVKNGGGGNAAFNSLVANSRCTYQLCIFPEHLFCLITLQSVTEGCSGSCILNLYQ